MQVLLAKHMPTQNSTRQRLLSAALELFTTLGITETTTKAVAELAQVNEVTLFRQFGNKHGLLLAVLEESLVWKELGESLKIQVARVGSVSQAIKDYANDRLDALEQAPGLLLSLVGEARHYPQENRQVLGKGLAEANAYLREYLATVMEREQLSSQVSTDKLASLLNTMLLGYAVIEFTSASHQLWRDRNEFLEIVVELLLNQAPAGMQAELMLGSAKVNDLAVPLVHEILQRAKKQGVRDYALAYILFGAGLSAQEIANLERSHQINDAHQYILQITQGTYRQVPLNQWILGKRYGSYTRNPLTAWLKSRKDEQPAMLLNDDGMPISTAEISQRWQVFTEGLLTAEGRSPTLEQAQQTWCVEMVTRGMELEALSILTGLPLAKLEPYARRAKEKLALEQAMHLDRKT